MAVDNLNKDRYADVATGAGTAGREWGWIHEVIGNPFLPMAFTSSWQTDTAVLLTRTMYESRNFSAMPILADALQDAGCDDEDILSHCRDTNRTHVRGCWVVELVLGRQ